ncbi:MAG: ABC transporter ATP-binding protein [Ornithinimicrobium sp.]
MAVAPASRPMTPARPSGAVLRRGMAIIFSGAKEQPWWLAGAVVGAVLWAGATVATAWAIGYLTDTVIEPAVRKGEVSAGGLWTIFGLLVAILVVNVIGVVLRRVLATVAGFNLQALYRQRVTRQYLRLPLTWHHRHPSGQLLSNAHSDIEATWQVFNPLPMALGVIVMLFIAGGQMLAIDPVLALIGLLVFPGLFVANLVYQRAMSPKITRAQQLRAEVSEVAHESFEAALVVKAMGREEQESTRFTRITNVLRDSLIDVGRTRGVFEPAIEAIPTLGTLAVLGVGTARVASADLGAAEVVQIAYLFSILAFPVRALGWVLAEIPRSVVGHQRVSTVLRAEGAMQYGDAALRNEGPAPARAREVDFAYRVDTGSAESAWGQDTGTARALGHEPRPSTVEHVPVIHRVDLDIEAGSTIALVGPTGSGKSTLASLLVRLVDPDAGSVEIDDMDVRALRAGKVSDAAALVAQQTFMFDDTVAGNVALDGSYDSEQILAALDVAQASTFVRELPHGLHTQVGERGGTLSGGQRQRIALARAIVRRPRLLVLDDATSAVDPSVEQQILERLRHARRGMTVLVVAYRMATILLADRVVYVERGRVVDQGSHTELLGRCEGYVNLVNAYSREAAQRAAVEAEERR